VGVCRPVPAHTIKRLGHEAVRNAPFRLSVGSEHSSIIRLPRLWRLKKGKMSRRHPFERLRRKAGVLSKSAPRSPSKAIG
jgi:hypothetical protein